MLIQRRFLFALLSLGLLALTAQETYAQKRIETLVIRFFQVQAEVASTPAERAQGLMGRKSLAPNHGMLFVFESMERQCFWMKNTPLPLTIAFIAEDGSILNTADMEPFSETPHCSVAPVRFALEMEQGWFRNRGVLVGDKVLGLPAP
jgi:uncharacterized membrane protein (UPF0127 family)